MRLAHRRTIVTIAALVAAARLPAVPLLAANNSAAAGPSILKVTTSRGAFDMMVYAPKSRLTDRPPGEQGVEPARADPKPVVLLISGEGGWKSFDILLSGFLSDDGFWVGGVDAKAYFWDPQDDRGLLAADMRSYATALKGAAGQPT